MGLGLNDLFTIGDGRAGITRLHGEAREAIADKLSEASSTKLRFLEQRGGIFYGKRHFRTVSQDGDATHDEDTLRHVVITLESISKDPEDLLNNSVLILSVFAAGLKEDIYLGDSVEESRWNTFDSGHQLVDTGAYDAIVGQNVIIFLELFQRFEETKQNQE